MATPEKDPRATDLSIWLPLYGAGFTVDLIQAVLTMTGVGILVTWVITPIASFVFWLWFKLAGIPVGLAKQGIAFFLDFIPGINWFNNTALVGAAHTLMLNPKVATLAGAALAKKKGKGATDGKSDKKERAWSTEGGPITRTAPGGYAPSQQGGPRNIPPSERPQTLSRPVRSPLPGVGQEVW